MNWDKLQFSLREGPEYPGLSWASNRPSHSLLRGLPLKDEQLGYLTSTHMVKSGGLFLLFAFWFFCLFTAYGSPQSRVQIGAVAASLHHNHSNARSLTHLLGPGIKSASSWMVVRLPSTELRWKHPRGLFETGLGTLRRTFECVTCQGTTYHLSLP